MAAGLNIASFNPGTALGGALGSLTIAYGNLSHVPLAGALAAVAAVALTWRQSRHTTPRAATAH